ncbi:MAG TPA: hypothetical protein VND87_11105 [Stellaceae bacterium]|nr:hypothetical protein [Stellaceae bacterium]
MRQASLGFLAGMVVMAAIVMLELWSLAPQQPHAGTEYGTGIATALCDC